MPRTWEKSDARWVPSRVPSRGRLYLLARSGQGFMTGVAVGVLWALWIVRRRRPGPDVLHSAAGGAASRAR